MDTPTDKEIGLDRHVAGLHGLHQIVQDLIRDRLMERAFVAVAPKIELEAFQLHAEFIRHVANADRGKIRLTGLGAEARELRAIHLNIIIPFWIRILEDLEFFRRLSRHNSPY